MEDVLWLDATAQAELVANKDDITLAEIKASLAERGVSVGMGTLWRFFDRHKITLKKSRRTRTSRPAQTS